jgi:hypothetical protein
VINVEEKIVLRVQTGNGEKKEPNKKIDKI